MKRIISILTVLTLVFVLSACEKGRNISIPESSTITAQTETQNTDTLASETNVSDQGLKDIEATSNFTSIPTTSTNETTTSSKETTSNTPSTNTNSSTQSNISVNKEQLNTSSSISNSSSTAQAIKNVTYSIIYEPNGGWGETSNSTHKYNEPRALSKNGYKRAGYTFIGWDENSKSNNPKFTNIQIVQNLTQTDGKVITLYAIWKESPTTEFDECKRAVSGKKEVYYHTTATDNFGVTHNDVAVFVNRDTYPGEKRYDERYTNGLFSKIKGTLYLSSDFTIDSYTNLQLIIKADGNIVFKSNFFTKYSSSQSFEVDISGANIVEIYVDDPVSPHIEAWNKGGDIIVENLLLVR